MNRLQATVRVLVLSCAAAWSHPAAADCTTDLDCPGPACGDAVCQRSVGVNTCVAAGTDLQGFDGACTTDADCKCATQGATCVGALHCSFTVSQDAGSASASTTDAGGSAATPAAGCALAGGQGSNELPVVLACAAGLALLGRGRRTRSPR